MVLFYACFTFVCNADKFQIRLKTSVNIPHWLILNFKRKFVNIIIAK